MRLRVNPKQGGALTSSRRKDSLRRSRRVPFSFGGERALDATASIRTRTTRIRNARSTSTTLYYSVQTHTSSSPIPPDNALFLLSPYLFSSKNQHPSKKRREEKSARILRFRCINCYYSFCIFFRSFVRSEKNNHLVVGAKKDYEAGLTINGKKNMKL